MIVRHRAFVIVSVVLIAMGCGDSKSGPLSPARNLEGTWKMPFPVTVYFDSDWCPGANKLLSSQDWDATWVITRGIDDNTVNVKMTFSVVKSNAINSCPGPGILPEVSPMFLTGNVSSATLTLKSGNKPAGTFMFTSSNMQGDFDYTVCSIWCQREYSKNRTFILRKQ